MHRRAAIIRTFILTSAAAGILAGCQADGVRHESQGPEDTRPGSSPRRRRHDAAATGGRRRHADAAIRTADSRW